LTPLQSPKAMCGASARQDAQSLPLTSPRQSASPHVWSGGVAERAGGEAYDGAGRVGGQGPEERDDVGAVGGVEGVGAAVVAEVVHEAESVAAARPVNGEEKQQEEDGGHVELAGCGGHEVWLPAVLFSISLHLCSLHGYFRFR
jgi:hypothetical protein